MHLPDKSFLQGGKYRIIRFISRGGFGCTYEAEHTLLEKRVAIKEFFAKDFCNRDETTSHVTVGTVSKKGLVEKLRRKFIEEARALCRMQHPGIVRVSDVFEENGTAYFVMDYIEGKSISEIVNEEGSLSEDRAVRYIRQVAEALQYVHDNNRLHLDIKPANIMIDGNDDAILIDFGASKQYDEEAGENTSTLLGKTPGYAPPEQMSNSVQKFLPATDIYALGATLYKMLTGVTPPDAFMRISGQADLDPLPSTISTPVREAVESAMSLKLLKRPQTVSAFLQLLGRNDACGTVGGDEGEETILDSEPLGSVHSRKPAQPRPSGQPKESVPPVKPSQPKTYISSEKPVQQKPVQQATSVQPAKPVQSAKTVQSSKPVQPEKPKETNGQGNKKAFPWWIVAFAAGVISVVVLLSVMRSSGSKNDAGLSAYADSMLTAVDSVVLGTAPPDQGAGETVGKPIVVESISLNKSSLSLEVGASESLTVRYTPSNAADKSTEWKSTDEKVAQVDKSGKVKAVGAGNAAIIASCNEKTAFCNVTVTARASATGNGSGGSSSPGNVSAGTKDEPAGPSIPEIEMVYVAGGTFTMGATSEQGSDAYSDEKPVHSVTLSGYYIGKYEVTQALWESVMGSNPSRFKGSDLPVERVSWNDVQEFIRKLNAKTGKNYRLPTEAEWEYAARGGNKSQGYKYSGSNDVGAVAWYDANSGDKTHPVGTKAANELGLHDMSGNVWEWCSDWYGDYNDGSQTNPKGPASGSERVVRGGGWNGDARFCRVSFRNNRSPGISYSSFGFRLAASSL